MRTINGNNQCVLGDSGRGALPLQVPDVSLGTKSLDWQTLSLFVKKWKIRWRTLSVICWEDIGVFKICLQKMILQKRNINIFETGYPVAAAAAAGLNRLQRQLILPPCAFGQAPKPVAFAVQN